MVAGLWVIAVVCFLVFGFKFRESHTIRLKYEEATPAELIRAYELETDEGSLAIIGGFAVLGAWILMVQ